LESHVLTGIASIMAAVFMVLRGPPSIIMIFFIFRPVLFANTKLKKSFDTSLFEFGYSAKFLYLCVYK
jgi:hypothetical protein